ncbi:MAG: tetratricopeptide repeat protein, partial [Pseudomonadota bacterium]
DNVRAWRYAMRGADHLWQGTPDSTALAREFLDKAVAEDPNYAAAVGLLGITYYIDLRFGYRGDPQVARRRIAECAEHGLTLDRTNPYVLVLRAIQLAVERHFDEAVNAIHHAIAASPNDAFVRVVAARILTNVERPAEAEREIRMAMRLNPHFSINYLAVLADALIIQGRLDEALATLRDLIGQNADSIPGHVYLIHLYMLMERTEDARREVREVLRLDPDYSLAKATDFYLSSNATVNAAFLDNLKKAGVPA